MGLVSELRRRNVIRVGAAYVVAAWLVIQVVETILPAFGFGSAAVRAIVIVLAILFIPVLVFAWAFELTPDGLKRDHEVDRSQSITLQTGKRLDRMIMVVLALALGYFAFDKFVLDPARDAAIAATAHQEGRSEALIDSFGSKSIAVLPFSDLSRDGDQEYMSDGIASELTNLLARIPKVRVVSRSSAFSYKGEKVVVADLAKALDVGYVLEGSVRLDGNRLRIDALLIDAHSDTVIWRETYDRTLDDIFAIQHDIASAIADELEIELLGDLPAVQQIHPEAYRLWLLANYLSGPGGHADHRSATNAMEAALTIDPDYAEGWRKLAVTYLVRLEEGELPTSLAVPATIEALEKSIRLAPDRAPTHTVIGAVAAQFELDFLKAAEHFNRAIELAPLDLLVLNNSTHFLRVLGRLDDAIAVSNYVLSQHGDMYALADIAEAELLAGRPDQAIAATNKVLSNRPGSVRYRYIIGRAYLQKGDIQTALEFISSERSELFRLLGQTMVHHAAGERHLSDAALNRLISDYGQTHAFRIAGVLAYRDEADRAFEWIDQAVDNRDALLQYAVAEPIFANIHQDPRWSEFLERINMSPAVIDAIEFEIPLPEQH